MSSPLYIVVKVAKPLRSAKIITDHKGGMRAEGSLSINGKYLRIQSYDCSMIFFMLRHFKPNQELFIESDIETLFFSASTNRDVSGILDWRTSVDKNGYGVLYLTVSVKEMRAPHESCIASKEKQYTLTYDLLKYFLTNFNDDEFVSSRLPFDTLLEKFKHLHEAIFDPAGFPYHANLINQTDCNNAIREREATRRGNLNLDLQTEMYKQAKLLSMSQVHTILDITADIETATQDTTQSQDTTKK